MSRPFLRAAGNDVDVMGVVQIPAIRLQYLLRPFLQTASKSPCQFCKVTLSWSQRTSPC